MFRVRFQVQQTRWQSSSNDLADGATNQAAVVEELTATSCRGF